MTAAATPRAMDLSVVIPTYNRRVAIMELMAALACQSLSPSRYEIIVVLDGATDDSAAYLAAWALEHPEFTLRLLQQSNTGQSAARTHGAARALASLLLFLDDDIVPGPNCLLAHVQRHHEADQPIVVLGDARVPRRERESYYDLVTRMWWDDMYAERAQRFPRVLYRDFCSSHVSLPRTLFTAVGGFDADFQGYGGEDYELGYRLLQAGATFVIEPNAQAWHHHRGSTRQVCRNLLDEGRNDVRLGRKHPELLRNLRCAKSGPAVRLIFQVPWFFRVGVACSLVALQLCEQLNLWSAWRWLLGKMRFCAYWLGVKRALCDWNGFRRFLESAPDPAT